MPDRQCEAFSKKGNRCIRRAKHFHETPGDAVYLCTQHYEMITDRMRQGSDEEHVRRWRHLLGSS